MKKVVNTIKNLFSNKNKKDILINKAVEHSVDKYCETYKLLEKYDEIGSKTPFLADDRSIKSYFQQI